MMAYCSLILLNFNDMLVNHLHAQNVNQEMSDKANLVMTKPTITNCKIINERK